MVTMLKYLHPHHHPLPSHPPSTLTPSPFTLPHTLLPLSTLTPSLFTLQPSTLYSYTLLPPSTITLYHHTLLHSPPSHHHPLPSHTPSTFHPHTITGWYNDITECACLNPGSRQPSFWALQHQKVSRSKHPAPCSSSLSI